ncbi:hypothetical protein Q4Q39_06790 [Flavivirga amylovorans]|uniref:Uncharacterized protein n=1 Tax=Flavivirga amylovorans TaxID=870486 RepID=A0ABT8X0G3_9FLAO|nr:DUF6804 family protein [Flavivirga amylovorans]MDO5987114.1 hypothetical protein [Flavivirga amylovorans]
MSTKTFHNTVRITSIICAILLFMAVLKAPREYYWLLRTVVSIGAVLVIFKNIATTYWVLLFLIVAILFNPIFPIYLYKKVLWMPLDIITGLLFLIEIITNKPRTEKVIIQKKEEKKYRRDRIL